MSDVPFVASPALIHRHALCFELRVLIEILPSIILRLISHLSFPGVLLASVVLRVRLERRYFIEVFVFVVAHVLFLCCLKIHQNPVSVAGTYQHTIVCMIYQKSTSRRYSPLFRFSCSSVKRSEEELDENPGFRELPYPSVLSSICRFGIALQMSFW